jgi:hypothetical protein
MPEKTIAMLSAYLWDLRVQCESQLRALTLAQRLLDDYRDAEQDDMRRQLKNRLEEDLRQIVKTNGTILENVTEAVNYAEGLPPAAPHAFR